ncbi:hypothetical protein OOU_Y34scaffold00461g5 [Pyricularia oryzae Y34]|uniref:Uncharacterized protein n=2 Tax=Pyricularia oryzae TaxID=318829 RepID=A0AA97PMK3_PYRO3|nr:hypothetical protein OOU_Y34scaffold00461g5 [Pyricularia oryzae Y34]
MCKTVMAVGHALYSLGSSKTGT